MMVYGNGPRISQEELDRVRLHGRLKQRDVVRRAKNFVAACEQLYAERMQRISNPATVRCPPEDVARARRFVADQLTWEADMARRYGPLGSGGP